MKTIIYIDYQTVKKIDLTEFETDDFYLIFFVASTTELEKNFMESIQAMNNTKVVRYKDDPDTPNINILHICFIMGEYHKSEDPSTEFIVASRDKGFKNIIKYIKSRNRKCRKLEDLNIKSIKHSLNLIDNSPKKTRNEDDIEGVIELLKEIKTVKRPKRKTAIVNYISNFFREKENKLEIANKLYSQLTERGIIVEKEEKNVEFHFPDIEKSS